MYKTKTNSHENRRTISVEKCGHLKNDPESTSNAPIKNRNTWQHATLIRVTRGEAFTQKSRSSIIVEIKNLVVYIDGRIGHIVAVKVSLPR